MVIWRAVQNLVASSTERFQHRQPQNPRHQERAETASQTPYCRAEERELAIWDVGDFAR